MLRRWLLLASAVLVGSANGQALFNAKELARAQPPKRALRAATSDTNVCGHADLSQLTSRVYVSNGGTDSATCGASMDAACGTIAYGIQRCAAAGCGVLVAWDEYTLTAPIPLRDGVSVYGGCVNADTSQAASLFSSILAPPDGIPAIRADGINQGALVQNFEVNGSAGNDGVGHASSTFVITNSSAVKLRDVSIVAGRGGSGAPGLDSPIGAKGDDANGTSGGLCGNKQSGGHGGSSNAPRDCANDPGQCWGQPASTQSGPEDRAVGGGQPDRMGVYNGPDGQSGAHGKCAETPGLPYVFGSGMYCCKTLGWQSTAASNGAPGQDGGGGGGGVIGMTVGNSGGGGGGGGVGGAAGQGGQSGGPSFGMLLVSSRVTLMNCHVYGGLSGNGGRGGFGGWGGQGGSGAPPLTTVPDGQSGGHGGNGGPAGAGSGGGGGNSGPSMYFAQLSSRIVETNVAYYPGTSGNPGAAGQGGGGDCRAFDGIDGLPGSVGKTLKLNCEVRAPETCAIITGGLDLPLPPLKRRK